MDAVADTPTRERILVTALQMFGERGYGGTAMRALTETAGVNIAAVNYHFGSKPGLLRAVVAMAMAEVNANRDRRLDELLADDARPTADVLADAFVAAGVGVTDRADGLGGDVARFLGRVVVDPDPEIRELFGSEVAPVEGRYLSEIRNASPDLPEAEIQFRYQAMVGLLALHQAGILPGLLPGHPPSKGKSDSAKLRQLVQRIFEA